MYHNLTGVNNTDGEILKEKLQAIANLVTLWYLPIIVSIGILGNTLTLIILLTEKKLAKILNPNDSFLKKFYQMKNQDKMTLARRSSTISKSSQLFAATNFSIIENNRAKSQQFQSHTFHNKNFSSANYFIFALASSDLVYNLILALVWISRANLYDVVNINYVCQITICISYICSFLSAAFTLLFTFQRFMAVVRPLKVATGFLLQSPRFITRLIIFLIVFSILMYSFSLFLYDTEPKKDYEFSESVRSCGVKESYTNFVYIFDNTIDSFLTLILPSIGIICMNIAICKSFSNHQKSILNESSPFSNRIKKSFVDAKNLKQTESMLNTSIDDHSSKLDISKPKVNIIKRLSTTSITGDTKSHCASASRHITKTLLIVSFAFILLNSPYRASKLISYIRMTLTGHYVYSNLEYAINEVLISLYFTSYSVNFFFYSLCGKKFRSSLQALILICLFYFCRKISNFFRFIMRCESKQV